jgi:glycosyltransferase involved in cell wall biosynthesis
MVVPAIERLLQERPALRFETFGTIEMPQSLKRFGRRVHSHAVNRSYNEFLSVLASLGWSAGLAPLENAGFNHCKAPTKFVEYAAAGIPVIASRVPVYGLVVPDDAGILVDEATDWYKAICMVLDHPEQSRMMAMRAGLFCAAEFPISRLKQQLREVFASKHKKDAWWREALGLARPSFEV